MASAGPIRERAGIKAHPPAKSGSWVREVQYADNFPSYVVGTTTTSYGVGRQAQATGGDVL